MEPVAIIGKLFSYQPVLDRHENIAGLMLQQRLAAGDDKTGSSHQIPEEAARQMLNALLYAGMSEPNTGYRYWLEVDAGFLNSSLPDYLPGEKIVLMMAQPGAEDTELASRCARLKSQRNYKLAISPAGAEALPPIWRELADVVCLRATDCSPQVVKSCQRDGSKVLACDLQDADSFPQLVAMGVDYLIGTPPVKPGESESESVLTEKTSILQLIQHLSNYESSSDRAIEEELKLSPDILMRLLELAGSAHLGMKSGLGSIRQILQVVGRQRIINWLYVLWLCARDGNSGLHALSFRALWRSRFMEQLVHYSHHTPGSHLQDQAFMTGILSLAPGMLGIPQEELFARLQIDPNIQQGLTQKTGMLGQLLKLTSALENADFELAEKLGHELHLNVHTVLHCQQEAVTWVNKTHRMIAD